MCRYIKPYSSLLTGRGWHSWSFTHGKNLIYSTTKVSLFWNEFKQFIYTRPRVWTVRTATNMRDIVGQSRGVMSPGHRLNQSGIDHVSQGLSSPLHSEYFNFFFKYIFILYMFKTLCSLFLRKNKNDSTEYFFWSNPKILIFFSKSFYSQCLCWNITTLFYC